MRIALFQPDIPQNTGTILRMAACLGVAVDVIGPTGFEMTDRSLKRAGLDYLPRAALRHHVSWEDFRSGIQGRLVLLSTHASAPYTEFAFAPDDTILFGRESAGAPDYVHEAANARLCIPLVPGLRSLNIAVAAAMTLGEALRQTRQFPIREPLLPPAS
ncbi:MAG: tRNA ((34)-2-O)-methyltransferase [Pseudomonadota bacterium]|jgi:tRNA (cytidine/uridine-2'-O-)-methyltransferase